MVAPAHADRQGALGCVCISEDRRGGAAGRRGRRKPSQGSVDTIESVCRIALRAGVGWAEFWESTPLATRAVLEAWADNQRDTHDRAIIVAFHNAYFSRMDKLGPKQLDQALGRKTKETPTQSETELVAAVFGWLRTTEAIHGASSN